MTTTPTQPAETVAAEGEVKAAPKPRAGKKKAIRQVSQGHAFVQATFNNTIVTLTDLNGNVLAWASSGSCGFKGPKKATPYAASVIVKTVTDKVKETGLKDVHVFLTGVGNGRDSAVRALNANGFQVQSIRDLTPLPHNGCRAKKPRRV